MTAQAFWYALSLSLFVLLAVLVWAVVVQRVVERRRLRAARRRFLHAARTQKPFWLGRPAMALPVAVDRASNEAVSWITIGGRKVHRACNEARRDGQYGRVCRTCAGRLGMAAAGGVG